MKVCSLSDNTIRRLPKYLRYLDEQLAQGTERISSKQMSEDLGLTASQIRQDLSCFGRFGLQGYGYNVQSLRNEISTILGIGRNYRAILLGVGNLGAALMENFSFDSAGITLLAAFDTDKNVIGTSRNGIPIYSVYDIPEYLEQNPVEIAVLAVPKDIAQSAADHLIQCGIRAIWNFTNVDLTYDDESVVMENIHFSDSLLTLGFYLSEHYESRISQIPNTPPIAV